jgi:hypothetical protein
MKSLGKGIVDKSLLVGSALLLAVLGIGTFALGDKYRVSPVWIMGLWLGILFVAAIGRHFRAKFRRPLFMVFFIAWFSMHLLIMLLAMSFLVFPLWIPLIFLELWIGYALAFRLFGLPPDKKA